MQTSYVSGANSFLAFNQGGNLNGVEYARNLVVFERYSSRYVQWVNQVSDLMLVDIFVSAGDITADSGKLLLQLITQWNGTNYQHSVWTQACNSPSHFVDGNYLYQGRNLNAPIRLGDSLLFNNSGDNNLEIKRVQIVFQYLVSTFV